MLVEYNGFIAKEISTIVGRRPIFAINWLYLELDRKNFLSWVKKQNLVFFFNSPRLGIYLNLSYNSKQYLLIPTRDLQGTHHRSRCIFVINSHRSFPGFGIFPLISLTPGS